MPLDPNPKLAPNSDHLSDSDVASRFESLGDNCEFGFYQRAVGVENLGLMRWSGITLQGLLRGIAEDFGVGNPDLETRVTVSDNEYFLQVSRYEWTGHSFKRPDTGDTNVFVKEQLARYRFLALKFLADMQEQRKIFVYRQNEPIIDDSIFVLHDALSWRSGNALLWVCEAEGDHPPGSVQFLRDGLMKGYIDRLSPRTAVHLISVQGWNAVLRRALDLWTAKASREKPRSLLRSVLLQELDFGAGRSAQPRLREGWQESERDSTWASGPRSTILLDKPADASEYCLRIKVLPFRPDGLLKQRMTVLVNGQEIKRFSAVPDAEIYCFFPPTPLREQERLEIAFLCPGALSPQAAGVSDDARQLAIHFRTLRLFGLTWR